MIKNFVLAVFDCLSYTFGNYYISEITRNELWRIRRFK